MALKFISIDSFPVYIAESTDISSGKIDGAVLIGKTVFLTDTGKWKIVTDGDGSVEDFLFPGVAP